MTGYNFTQANNVRISKELKVILTKQSMNKIKEWIYIKDITKYFNTITYNYTCN